jgi:cytochrome c-type biogenesis protein
MMKKILLVFAFVFLVSGYAFAAEGRPAANFSLKSIEQETVSLSDYKGKNPVLLFFWTTWCPYCRKELSELGKKNAALAADNITVLSINIGESSDKVEKYLKSRPAAVKVLLDEDSVTAHDYGLIGVPTFVLINQSGNIVFKDNYFSYNNYKALLE